MTKIRSWYKNTVDIVFTIILIAAIFFAVDTWRKPDTEAAITGPRDGIPDEWLVCTRLLDIRKEGRELIRVLHERELPIPYKVRSLMVQIQKSIDINECEVDI